MKMANEGLRSYTKQIQNTIGNVASAYINLNRTKFDGNKFSMEPSR